MCCRRRGQRAPMVAVLGNMAYEKYREHQAERRAIADGSSPDPNHRRLSHDSFPDQANNEVLENAGIDPPSYHEVTANRTIVPLEPGNVVDNGEWVKVTGEDKLEHSNPSDTESSYAVVDGMRVPHAQMGVGVSCFSEKWMTKQAEKQLRREGKLAARQAKYERKLAEKAAKYARKNAKHGGCC